MKAFTYRSAPSAEAATKWLGENALALAGGSNLLNLLKEYVLQPDVLVDIKKIPGTSSIEKEGGRLRIGANVTLSRILDDERIRKGYPALHQALWNAGSPQIRNVATLGGNLCARPGTCWYYVHKGFDCLKRGGSTCPAREGENDYHAIFDNDASCVAVHPSSAAPALIVYDAVITVAGPKGNREVPAAEFFVSPRNDPKRETVLAPNEIVTHVVLGPPNPHSATYEVREKLSHDWPLAMASVALTMEDGVCRGAKICLGAVAPTPWPVPKAAKALAGKKIDEASADTAAGLAIEGAKPLAKNGYKIPVTRTAVRRAILKAAGKLS